MSKKGRPLSLLPSTSLYDPEKYKEDKRLGVRRENGAANLKKLKPIHRQVFALHMSGRPNTEISDALGLDYTRVSMIINDPLMQTLIAQANDDLDGELRALFPMALDTLRKGMNSGDLKVGLKASDQFFRTQGKYRQSDERDQTAEDVIRDILEIHSEGPVSVKIGSERKVTR